MTAIPAVPGDIPGLPADEERLVIMEDGAQVYAARYGRGEPLLLIAGMSQDHRVWEPQIGPLSQEFCVIVLDNRGTGRSDDIEYTHDTHHVAPTTGWFAQDAVAVLDDFGIERAHVVGFSMGGRIAQWLAVSHAARIGALILLASAPGDRYGIARSPEADRVLLAHDNFQLAILNYSPGWLQRNGALAKRIGRATSTRASQRQLHYEASHSHDAWSALPYVKAPVLAIHGTDDEINPVQNSSILAGRIAGMTVEQIEGGRHGVAAEFSEQVNALITGFLRQHPLDAGGADDISHI